MNIGTQALWVSLLQREALIWSFIFSAVAYPLPSDAVWTKNPTFPGWSEQFPWHSQSSHLEATKLWLNDAINNKEVNTVKRAALDFTQMIIDLCLQESCVFTETGGLGRKKEKLNDEWMNEWISEAGSCVLWY